MAILADSKLLMEVIRGELKQILDMYGDVRKTVIIASRLDLSREDLTPNEQMVLTVSHTGYAKIQLLSDYRAQKRYCVLPRWVKSIGLKSMTCRKQDEVPKVSH